LSPKSPAIGHILSCIEISSDHLFNRGMVYFLPTGMRYKGLSTAVRLRICLTFLSWRTPMGTTPNSSATTSKQQILEGLTGFHFRVSFKPTPLNMIPIFLIRSLLQKEFKKFFSVHFLYFTSFGSILAFFIFREKEFSICCVFCCR